MLSVTSLELLPSNADTPVGQEIHIPLVVFGKYQGASIPFINCSLLPLHISMDKGGVFSIQKGEIYCITMPMYNCSFFLFSSWGKLFYPYNYYLMAVKRNST